MPFLFSHHSCRSLRFDHNKPITHRHKLKNKPSQTKPNQLIPILFHVLFYILIGSYTILLFDNSK
ncbi:hypothetical protein CROQUDRAFT_653981, partial [Cronartium quercuum f. sp. fusiforme G11]